MKKYLFNFALLTMLLEGTMQIRAQIPGLNYNVEGDYYEIASSADMENLSKYVRANKGNTCAGCTFKVIVDSIALSDDFVMIGNGSASSQEFNKRPFSGVFDGQGAAISWGKKKFSTPSHALFAYVLGGTVKNVRLYVDLEGINAMSGLVLNNYGGTISDCVVNGSIEGYIGVAGIVYSNGYMTIDDEKTYGTISNCVSNVHLKGYQNIGGIVNSNYGEVINCVNNGVFECGSGYVGGIAADNHSSGTISYCRNESPVISTNYQNTGGIVGSNAGTVEYCENFAVIASTHYFTGGIVGHNNGGNALVNHCTNSKDVRATDTKVGGIVGANWNGMISGCLMTSGRVSGYSFVGAIVGENRSILSENYYYEEVTVSDNTGSYFQTQPRGRGSAGDSPIDVTEQTVKGVTYYNGAVLYQPEDKTAIGRVASQVSDNDAPIYTLQGFRVAPGSLQGRKGLFIKRSNGRKSVVKRH